MTAETARCGELDESLLCAATGLPCPGKIAIAAELKHDLSVYYDGSQIATGFEDYDDDWNGEDMYPRSTSSPDAGPLELRVKAAAKKIEYNKHAKRKGCDGPIDPGTLQEDCPTRLMLVENPHRQRFLKLIRTVTKRV